MGAQLSIIESNGDTPTLTPIESIAFCTSDVTVPGTSYPLVKPSEGNTNYSYKKTIYLNAVTSPSGGINNIKFYCDGTIGWTGVEIEVKAVDIYVKATGTEGTTGVDNEGTDIETYTAASPLSLTGSIGATTGKISQYLELQAVVSDTAVAGALNAETLTIRYDEF